MYPKARKEKLTVREMPDETLVYDLEKNKAHCLNRTSALVWKHCDGRTSVAELAQLAGRELGLADALPVVELALEQLSRRHLLEQPVDPLTEEARLSRRKALRKLAALAVALPLAMTITASKARADHSPFHTLLQQQQQQASCSGVCNSNADCQRTGGPRCFCNQISPGLPGSCQRD